jgi:MarR family transcriptional regulator, negative regulator of the multidrug operon emrRAB
MHDVRRTANLLGAAALAVNDLAVAEAKQGAGASASGAAALVVLDYAGSLSVTDLGRRIGLSQPAAARMVDALEASRLVERKPGSGRSVAVQLTPAGRRALRRAIAARETPLVSLVDSLDEDEQDTLSTLLAKLLTQLYESGANERICRLCDHVGCTANDVCPVGEAERRRAV